MQIHEITFGRFTDYVLFIMGLNARGYIHLNEGLTRQAMNRLEQEKSFVTSFAGQTTMKINFVDVSIIDMHKEFKTSDRKKWGHNELNGTDQA